MELLHVWRNRAFAYQKVLEVDGIRAESVDQKMMCDYLAELDG